MSTQTKKVLVSFAPRNPVIVPTPWRGVAVYGHEFVSPKEVEILTHCLNRDEFGPDQGDHGVMMIVFRNDDRPAGNQAICIPDSGAIVINLEQVWGQAMDEVIENMEESLFSAFHRNMILNFLHEIHHMVVLQSLGGVPEDQEQRKDLEAAAEEWAFKELMSMAKSMDIELGHENHFLNGKLCELRAVSMTEGGAFEKAQVEMAENRIMYHLPEDGKGGLALTLMSFKGICHLLSGDDQDDPAWAMAMTTTPIQQEAQPVVPVTAPITAPDTASAPAIPAPATHAETTALFPQEETIGGEGAEYLDIPEPDAMAVEEQGGNETGIFADFAGGALANFVLPTVPTAVPATFPMADGTVPAMTMPDVVHQAEQIGPAVMIYPQTGLTPEQTRDVVFSVFNKIYYHIFSNCGRLLNSDVGFKNPEAVALLPIKLTDQEKAVVVKCDCLDANGRWCPDMPTVGGLRGFIMKNSKLPAYKMYINNGGYEVVRLVLPQNPGKTGAGGAYTKTALQARGGTCIAYVMEGADKSPGEKGVFMFKCVDGRWESCRS